MNDTKRMMRLIGTTLAAAIFLGSCSIGLTPDTAGPEEEIARLDEIIGVTATSAAVAAEAQLQVSGNIGATAAYNFEDSTVSVAVPSGGTADLPERSNFPYPNWTTGGSIKHIDDPATFGNNRGWTEQVADQFDSNPELFQVTVTARPDEVVADAYPEAAVREVYYIVSADLTVDITDQASYFDPFGYSGAAYRDEYVAEYTDLSTREHWIIGTDSSVSIDKMGQFDINGSMGFVDVYTEALSAGGDDTAEFSSLTLYTHDLGQTYNFWFWNDNDAVEPMITGWRYYTEHVDEAANEWVSTSVTFEYTTNTASGDGPKLLARSTIREEMRFQLTTNSDGNSAPGAATDHTLRLQTEINNSSGGADLLYARNGKQITSWNNRGNAQTKQLENLGRDVLPRGYSDVVSQFDVALDEIDETI